MTKWDIKFLALAEHISRWSKDPSTKVGAVIVRPKTNVCVSFGYNGFPIGVVDSDERLANRELKYPMIVHAEANAIAFARQDITGCTLYLNNLLPCSTCAGLIIQSGIKRVVSNYKANERWDANFEITRQMFDEAGVTLEIKLIEDK